MGQLRSLAACAALLLSSAALAAPPQVETYGALKDGRTVERFTLRNAKGMTVRMLSLGGIITEISAPDRNGKFDNVVFAKPDLAAYAAGSSFSSLLGRYANRISGGGFTLDGKRYDLVGANPAGVVIHGGPNAFSTKLWQSQTFGGARGPTGVTMKLVDPDGYNGFPGTMHVTARYTLDDNNTLRLEFEATTDKPTVVNLSHHVYFNLAGSNVYPADDQCVQLLSDRYGVLKSQLMTGELRDVSNSPFDLRLPTRLGDRTNKGYPDLPRGFDTPFIVRNQGAALVPIARAWDPTTGRTLEMRTNQTSVQFFTPPTSPGIPRPWLAPGATPPPPPPHVAGYAIEAQHLPESPNFPSFPSTVLRPGQMFRSATSWHFGTYDPTAGPCRPKAS